MHSLLKTASPINDDYDDKQKSLSAQLSHAANDHQIRNFTFSINARFIILIAISVVYFPIDFVLNGITNFNLICAMFLIIYGVIMTWLMMAARLNTDIRNEKSRAKLSLLAVFVDNLLLVSMVPLWGQPPGISSLHVYYSLYFIILFCAYLFGVVRITMFSMLMSIVSVAAAGWFDHKFNSGTLDTEDSLLDVMYLLVTGLLLMQENRIYWNYAALVRKIVTNKVMIGVYSDLSKRDGVEEHGRWSLFSICVPAESYVSADCVATKEEGSSLIVMVADITSHGVNVSQGAVVAMSAFHAAMGEQDPARLILMMDNALWNVSRDNGGEGLAIVLKLSYNGTVTWAGDLGTNMWLMRHGGGAESLKTSGFSLGKGNYSGDKTPKERTVKLLPGDQIVVVSDGAETSDPNDDKTTVIMSYHGGGALQKQRARAVPIKNT